MSFDPVGTFFSSYLNQNSFEETAIYISNLIINDSESASYFARIFDELDKLALDRNIYLMNIINESGGYVVSNAEEAREFWLELKNMIDTKL